MVRREDDHLELEFELEVFASLSRAETGVDLITEQILGVEAFSDDFKDGLIYVVRLDIGDEKEGGRAFCAALLGKNCLIFPGFIFTRGCLGMSERLQDFKLFVNKHDVLVKLFPTGGEEFHRLGRA